MWARIAAPNNMENLCASGACVCVHACVCSIARNNFKGIYYTHRMCLMATHIQSMYA